MERNAYNYSGQWPARKAEGSVLERDSCESDADGDGFFDARNLPEYHRNRVQQI